MGPGTVLPAAMTDGLARVPVHSVTAGVDGTAVLARRHASACTGVPHASVHLTVGVLYP